MPAWVNVYPASSSLSPNGKVKAGQGI